MEQLPDRERVDNLRNADSPNEDSMYNLAKEEDNFRELIKNEGVIGEKQSIDKIAGKFTDKNLEKKEAELREKKAEKMASFDALTGVYSRNAYDKMIPQQLSLAGRDGKAVSLLMLDFDNFKMVNDTYGHGNGDNVLKQVANIIKNNVRASDLVYRYGGEEFVVYLPNTSRKGARKLAEKIRHAIEEARIKIEKDNKPKEIKQTVSIGGASTNQIRDWKQLVRNDPVEFFLKINKLADDAVYLAKDAGKNKVVMYSEQENGIVALKEQGNQLNKRVREIIEWWREFKQRF